MIYTDGAGDIFIASKQVTFSLRYNTAASIRIPMHINAAFQKRSAPLDEERPLIELIL